jgi:hypothetical protein
MISLPKCRIIRHNPRVKGSFSLRRYHVHSQHSCSCCFVLRAPSLIAKTTSTRRWSSSPLIVERSSLSIGSTWEAWIQTNSRGIISVWSMASRIIG